jgi:large subunit ribosomal protein L4e
MMKLKTVSIDGSQGADVELPSQFSEELREDLIKKAVLAVQNNKRQPYGSFVDAGDRHVSWVSKRRRDWRGSYGKGISRVPRKVLSRRGSQFFWVGAQAPGTVGGRRAHPPKAEKVWAWKINDSERRKAIRSALSATVDKELVAARGHLLPANYPFIIDETFEKISKTKDLVKALKNLGFENELERALAIKATTGRARFRGRATKRKKSILIVGVRLNELSKAAKNIPGVDTVSVKKINAEMLAPGGHYGRAALFTTSAVEEFRKGLFAAKQASYTASNESKKQVAVSGKKKQEIAVADTSGAKKQLANKEVARTGKKVLKAS